MVLGIIFHLLPKGYVRNISLLEANMDASMYTLRSVYKYVILEIDIFKTLYPKNHS